MSLLLSKNIDTEKIVLSNGATIYLKKTDFKNDEIQFSGAKSGGISLAEDGDYWSASMASEIVGLSGIGDYSYTDLQKALAGKSVGVGPYLGDMEAGFSGSASPKDVETMLQTRLLVFLRRSEETKMHSNHCSAETKQC